VIFTTVPADNRGMRIRPLLWVIALLAASALPARAGVPDPKNSTADTCMVISPAGVFSYKVTVRDESAAPVSGVQVVLDFTPAPGMNLCDQSDPDHDRRIVGTTDLNGTVTFNVRGGGQTSGFVVVSAFAQTIVLAHVRSTDLNGDLAVTAADVTLHQGLPANSLAGDYNCDGVTDSVDRGILSVEVGTDCNTTPVLDSTWGKLKASYR
jgi:hypothetical protein